ncbi:MAG TPA: methyltransferase [Gemmatales bacterium]|nr:methyltransferase [Gemmatales bacterium]
MSADHDDVPCFALTVPGLEKLAAAEIEQRLDASVKRTESGLVVFRCETLDRRLFRLRLVEDLYLLAWGSDALTYRSSDLKLITQWTRREADWEKLFRLHRTVTPKLRGKPSYHLVAQMRGEHGYRRVDLREALVAGLRGKIPDSWVYRDEGAAVEIWLRIEGRRAICGLRLTDDRMRHRQYKDEHLPASLRPVVAATMVRLARLEPTERLVDPLCGAGTILAERLAEERAAPVLGGDCDRQAVRAALINLRHFRDEPLLVRWDATELPLANGSVTCLVSNPPFGKQIGAADELGPFYHELVEEFDRVLAPGGRAVVLVGDDLAFQKPAARRAWMQEERVRLRLLGQPCFILCFRKPTTPSAGTSARPDRTPPSRSAAPASHRGRHPSE